MELSRFSYLGRGRCMPTKRLPSMLKLSPWHASSPSVCYPPSSDQRWLLPLPSPSSNGCLRSSTASSFPPSSTPSSPTAFPSDETSWPRTYYAFSVEYWPLQIKQMMDVYFVFALQFVVCFRWMAATLVDFYIHVFAIAVRFLENLIIWNYELILIFLFTFPACG